MNRLGITTAWATVAIAACFTATRAETPASLPAVPGPFEATPESLTQYQCPEWFRDAKFGIWSHWGPQAAAQDGDWYARRLYEEGSEGYNHHLQHFGHPTTQGYKDIIPLWKAENWDPDALMARYKKAGARYFVAQAVHHDNFDNWDSKYHRWNAVNMGPHKDIVGTWQQAAIKQGLHFGVSEHLAASYTWFQSSHRADKQGPLAGKPFDGNDPQYQDLYHPAAEPGDTAWYSNNAAWHQEWFNRISDLVDHYHPDLLYSDGALPFSQTGRDLLSRFYNGNIAANNGKLQAVYNCKQEDTPDLHAGSFVQDVERGGMKDITSFPWQTDTSTGDWFYRINDHYKSSGQVIHMLADIVSKNGNLLLNVVQKPDGSLPSEMDKFLDDMSNWIAINGEAIYDTRPWLRYGEGPTKSGGGAFNENAVYTAKDIRFTTKDGNLYAIALGVPQGELVIRSLAQPSWSTRGGTIQNVTLLGSDEPLKWTRDGDGLHITPPAKWPCDFAVTFKIVGQGLEPAPLVLTALKQSADGSLMLAPEQAELSGKHIATEQSNDVANIGYWDNPDATAAWTARVSTAGSFVATIEVASPNEGVQLTLQCGNESTTATLPKTGGFGDYTKVPFPPLNVPQNGQVKFTLKPHDAKTWHAVNVRTITLVPQK